jgi:hypothetical protein
MSQVRNALKRAENWDGKEVFTGESPVFDPSTVVLSRQARPTSGLAKETALAVLDSIEKDEEPSLKPAAFPRWMPRWCRRLIRTHTQVARCTGTTRRGLPCRAPAMDNGFCRMHGGERAASITERAAQTRVSLLGRLLPSWRT